MNLKNKFDAFLGRIWNRALCSTPIPLTTSQKTTTWSIFHTMDIHMHLVSSAKRQKLNTVSKISAQIFTGTLPQIYK